MSAAVDGGLAGDRRGRTSIRMSMAGAESGQLCSSSSARCGRSGTPFGYPTGKSKVLAAHAQTNVGGFGSNRHGVVVHKEARGVVGHRVVQPTEEFTARSTSPCAIARAAATDPPAISAVALVHPKVDRIVRGAEPAPNRGGETRNRARRTASMQPAVCTRPRARSSAEPGEHLKTVQDAGGPANSQVNSHRSGCSGW